MLNSALSIVAGRFEFLESQGSEKCRAAGVMFSAQGTILPEGQALCSLRSLRPPIQKSHLRLLGPDPGLLVFGVFFGVERLEKIWIMML